MELLLFIGLQGSGKSTFYARRFLQSHLRLSRDLLRSANREDVLFHAALALKQRVVLDNTHLTPQTRRRRIDAAHAEGYRVVGVFFDTPVAVALARNAERTGDARVPDRAIRGSAAKLTPPTPDEGYDALFRVVGADGAFTVSVLHDPDCVGLTAEE